MFAMLNLKFNTCLNPNPRAKNYLC